MEKLKKVSDMLFVVINVQGTSNGFWNDLGHSEIQKLWVLRSVPSSSMAQPFEYGPASLSQAQPLVSSLMYCHDHDSTLCTTVHNAAPWCTIQVNGAQRSSAPDRQTHTHRQWQTESDAYDPSVQLHRRAQWKLIHSDRKKLKFL